MISTDNISASDEERRSHAYALGSHADVLWMWINATLALLIHNERDLYFGHCSSEVFINTTFQKYVDPFPSTADKVGSFLLS
jgi:hypothetical protein